MEMNTNYILDLKRLPSRVGLRERNRRNPDNQYVNAQWDETAFGKRKYHRGRSVRNPGVQWGLTAVEVDPLTKKTIALDLQFLPYNRRNTDTIVPKIVQRMKPGGVLTTDCWRAYPAAAEAAKVMHLTVNHSVHFKDPDTGAHTNHVEGIHAVLKKDCRQQFGRLPYLSSLGETYYLDLLVWRANTRLKKSPLFLKFVNTLWLWTNQPLEGWERLVPVMEQETEGQDDLPDNNNYDNDSDGDWFVNSDDDNNFL